MIDLKNMSNKKKAEYIWDYYKLHIIGVLAIILIVASLIHSQITKIDYVFNLTMIGNTIDENKRVNFEKQLTSFVIKPGDKKKQAIVDIIPADSSNSVESIMSNQYMQKFVVRISVGDLDVVILDKKLFESLVKQDTFLKLENISQLNLATIKNEKIEASGSDNKKAVYAINAVDIKMFNKMGFDTHNKVIGIISSCKQKEKAASVLKWLLRGA